MLKMFAGSRGAAGRGASSFAHLVGLAPQGKKPKGEEDEACPPKGEEEGASSAEEEEEEPTDTTEPSQPEDEDGGKGGKKGKKSEKAKHASPEDEDGEGDDEEDDDSEDADAEEVKKAKAAGFGGAIKAARRMEKRRCAAILRAPQAAANVALAASLACETDLSAAKAIAVLGNNGRAGGLSQRMAETPNPRISGGSPSMGRDPVSASWGRAMADFMPKS